MENIKLTRKIVNLDNPNGIEVELTVEEIEQLEKDRLRNLQEEEDRQVALKAEEEAQKLLKEKQDKAKASLLSKLSALGITEEEFTSLVK